MSKKPMYLKRRASFKPFLLLVIVVLLAAVWYLLPKSSKQLPEEKEIVQVEEKQEFPESVFQGQVEEITAPKSGIKAYYMFQEGGLTAMSFTFTQAGSAYDKPGQEGIAGIVARTLKEGAGWWTAKELRNLMGIAGVKIGFSASNDDFTGYVTFPNGEIDNAVKYLREILLNASFEDKYVEAAKVNVIRAIEAQKEDPSSELALAFNKVLYGDFAYGKSPLGEINSIRGINRRALASFVRSRLGKNHLFVGIVGNVRREDAEKMIDDVFAKLPEIGDVDIGSANVNWNSADLNIARNIPQNIAVYAVKGTCRKCEDFYPLYIANYIVGGAGLNSRLNQEMREKENLTYGVSSWLDLNDKSDILRVSFSATSDNMSRARQLFEQIWHQVKEKGFTSEELQNAKDYLVASHNLRFASTLGIAEMLAYMQKYDLGIDFLNQRNRMVKEVTLQQLNQVAEKYFGQTPVKGEIGNINK